MYLPALTDPELIRYADQTLDPLTSTDLERELLKRFEAAGSYDDLEEQFSSFLGVVQEAIGQFPDEDFLQDAIERIQDLAQELKGRNKEEAQSIASLLGDIQLASSNAAEYARTEIHKASK